MTDLCGEYKLEGISMDVRHPFDADAVGIAIFLYTKTILIFENPEDGYRSTAEEPIVISKSAAELSAKITRINAPVIISERENADTEDGIIIRDKRNNEIILTVGTDFTDDYYPMFVMQWHPENLYENKTQ